MSTPSALVAEEEPAWGRTVRLVQPDLPAFWVAMVMVVTGAIVVQARLAPAINRELAASSLAFVLWGLYTVPIVALIIWLDLLEPEPPAFLGAAFAWGAIAAAALALVANSSALSILVKVSGPAAVDGWWGAAIGPSTEEPIKALGIVLIVLIAGRQMTTVLDGLVYGMFVGLGFQVAESLVATFDRLPLASFGGRPGALVLDVFMLRGLGLGLWCHVAYSAIAGAGIAAAAISVDRSRWVRTGWALGALVAAWTLHLVWNSPWLAPSAGSSIGDVAFHVVKAIPAAVILTIVVVMARRREVVWMKRTLATEDVSVQEIDAVATAAGRRQHRRAARARAGRRGEAAARNLERPLVALACTLATSPDDESAIGAARLQLVAARGEDAGGEE